MLKRVKRNGCARLGAEVRSLNKNDEMIGESAHHLLVEHRFRRAIFDP